VLDAGEQRILQGLLREMNAHIRRRAAQFGWAYFELEALYGLPNLKPPFSAVALMTTATPYGPYITLDGFHPSALGHTVLAQAAAQALNSTYGMHLNAFVARATPFVATSR
jgi:lysophospholipase L1-like esterase